jgi:hypothetical protein
VQKERNGATIESILKDLVVRIYHGTNEDKHDDGSFVQAMASLKQVGIEKAQLVEVQATDLVVVGKGREPRTLSPDDMVLHLRVALRAYIKGDKDYRVLDQSARDYILSASNWESLRRYDGLLPLIRAAHEQARKAEDSAVTTALAPALPSALND